MYFGRVKTYIIIILAIANVMSAALLGWKYYGAYGAYGAERQAREDLITLLREKGAAVTDLPMETAARYVTERDIDAERAAAEALIGACGVTDVGGGIYSYQGEGGTATFRSGGRFEINIGGGGMTFPAGEQSRGEICKKLMDDMGFAGYTDDFTDNGERITFGQMNDKNPVFNTRAVFGFAEDGRLESVSGLWMAAAARPADGALCKSAGAALLILADSGEGNMEIEEIRLGFRLRAVTPSVSGLTPEWRVLRADGECHYIDAFEGVIVTAED